VLFHIDEPTTLSWTWKRESVIVTQADPAKGGTVEPVDPFWAASETVATITATPKPGYAFHHWNDDLTATSTTYPLVVDGPTTMTAHFYPLVKVISVVPAVGTPPVNASTPVPYGSPVGISVQSPYVDMAAGIRRTCTGATVRGLESGSTTNFNVTTFTLTMNEPVEVTWNWSEPEYYLDASARPVGGGEVVRTSDGQPAAGFYEPGTKLTLRYTTHPDFVFEHWSGDVSGTQATVSVVMDGPRKAFAYFRPVQDITYQGSRLNLLSQTGGASYATALDDKYAYLGEGPNLTVLDISRPAEPQDL
jgi:hypothetical protein